jgi:hypothetical protein
LPVAESLHSTHVWTESLSESVSTLLFSSAIVLKSCSKT